MRVTFFEKSFVMRAKKLDLTRNFLASFACMFMCANVLYVGQRDDEDKEC